MLTGEFLDFFWATPRRIVRSIWPNLAMIPIRVMWLLLAVVLFYGLYIDRSLQAHDQYGCISLVALVAVVSNVPLLILHASLCVPNIRKEMQRISKLT